MTIHFKDKGDFLTENFDAMIYLTIGFFIGFAVRWLV